MRRGWYGSMVVVPTMLALCACGESAPRAGGWAGTVDTLENGRVLVHNEDVPLWEEGEAWQLREVLRIGSADGDGPDLFGQINGVQIGEDGSLYVLDGQASEVRVFGPDGVHLRTIGRQGQGPGELSRPLGIAFDPAGLLWVNNWGNARYTAYDATTGDVVREPRRLAGFAMIPWPGAFDRAGRMLDVGMGPDGEPVILGLDTAYVPVDTLPMPRADDRYQVFFRANGQIRMSMMEPFAPQPSWAPHPDGGIVVGEGSAYRLHRITVAGDTVATIEVARPRIQVTSAERDSALAQFEEISQLAGGATPDRRPSVPDVKPAHGALFVDEDARIWVTRTPARGEGYGWDVFDPEGRLLGVVTLPTPPGYVRPAVRGATMAVVTTVDDVPAIVVYEIQRSGGEGNESVSPDAWPGNAADTATRVTR